jgi:flagellar basal-body rod modification protein FlgD
MFTKLLVAQIQNQDPLSPSDPSQFVQQLTQLSQTEALQSLASLTSNNASVLQSMQVLGLGAQVGSDVMAAATAVQLDGAKVGGSLTLGSNSSKTQLVLTGTMPDSHELALGQ